MGDERAFEEVNAKLDKSLGQLQWIVGVLVFEGTWWKELGAMNFAQLWCFGST